MQVEPPRTSRSMMPVLEPCKTRNSKRKKPKSARFGGSKRSQESSESLLTAATSLLITGQPELALLKAKRALRLSQVSGELKLCSLPALNLLGETSVQLGDYKGAQAYFIDAITLDPDGKVSDETGDGSSKFFWMAQLSDEGGASSISWFEKGANILRREIAEADKLGSSLECERVLGMKEKLASALCGMAEIYMTDLSWEVDAESRSEIYATEALLVAPHAPEPLQTLASIRLSQERMDEAHSALSKSLQLWSHLPPDNSNVPDFSSRISLSRLLMEAHMEEESMKVLERLILEDNRSVEAWYLGGWCLYLSTTKDREASGFANGEPIHNNDSHLYRNNLRQSRQWLLTCLDLYRSRKYEDERMKDHAEQLLYEINSIIGEVHEDDENIEADWEDEDEIDNIIDD